MSSIYQLTAGQRELMNLVESGEISEKDAADTFEGMEAELNEKLNDYNIVLRSLGLGLENIESEIDRLKKLQSEKKNQIQSVKQRMIDGLTNIKKTKFDTGLFKGHIRNGQQSVVVSTPSMVPAEYIETRIDEKPNKNDIKSAILEGKEIPGCELQTGKPSLIIK